MGVRVMDRVAFAQRLRQLRKEKAVSQREIGEEVGVRKDAILKWESGQRLPKKPEEYSLLASYFDVSVEYLKGETNTRGSYLAPDRDKTSAKSGKDYEEHIQEIMDAYQALSVESREVVDALIEKLYRLESDNETKGAACQ